MIGYFDQADRTERLQEVARAWIGTPFAVHQHCVGAGVDCVHLVGEIMLGTGVVESYAFPDYQLDHSIRSERSIITEFLTEHPRFALPSTLPVQAGDVVTFRLGKCVHHCGVALSDRVFIHAVAGRKVTLARLDDPTWSKRLVAFWRAMP